MNTKEIKAYEQQLRNLSDYKTARNHDFKYKILVAASATTSFFTGIAIGLLI